MRRILLIAGLCLLAVVSPGCKKARIRAQLKELMGSTIVLPERITCVKGGEVYPMPDSLRSKAKLLVYVDSAECQTCRLSQLSLYQQAYYMAEETNAFELCFLLGDTQFSGIPLARYVSDLDIPFPVYIDDENIFLEMNPKIAKNVLFHSLFLDSQGKVRFVGDPVRNTKIKSLLERTMDTIFSF